MNSHEVFIHIHQGCFAGTGAIVRLPKCQWSKPDGYGKISQCITTTKHSKAKTVCIFLGIYCSECLAKCLCSGVDGLYTPRCKGRQHPPTITRHATEGVTKGWEGLLKVYLCLLICASPIFKAEIIAPFSFKAPWCPLVQGHFTSFEIGIGQDKDVWNLETYNGTND